MKIETAFKLLLLVHICKAREIGKVEGIGELGEFGIRLLHSILPQRGQRRISEDEESVEARFFQQQQQCPYGQCGPNSGLQLVYPQQQQQQQQLQQIVQQNIQQQAPKFTYQTSFTSNGYNPTIDSMIAPQQTINSQFTVPQQTGLFEPVSQGQFAPKPVSHQNITPPAQNAKNSAYYQSSGSEAGQGLKIVPQASTPNRQPSITPVFRPASTIQPAKVYDTKRADQPIDHSAVNLEQPSGPGCKCVPVAQCPTAKSVFLGNKDYSGHISPRNNPATSFSSNSRRRHGGRSIKFNDSENELNKDSTEQSTNEETSESITMDSAEVTTAAEGIVIDETTITGAVDTETTTEQVLSRRKRDSNDEFFNRGARLENVYVPDEDYQTDPEDNENESATTPANIEEETTDKDDITEGSGYVVEGSGYDVIEGSAVEPAYNIQPRGSTSDIESDLKQKLKEERKKKRQEKRKNRNKNKKGSRLEYVDIEEPTSELDDVDYDVEDKSFDSISDLTTDVKNKVGSSVNSVTSGVTNLFSGLNNLISTKTSNGQLKPIVGLSFGLPQTGAGYGGYQNNPVNSGSAVNPYYTSPTGIELGPVNFNPLVSLQAGTNDDGDLAVQPLINLHLTPNGCGILGCKEYDEYGNPTVPRKIADALLNPVDAIKKPIDYLINKGQELANSVSGNNGEQYGYGPNSGYGVPQTGYGVPQTGYGVPQTGYGVPQTSYGVPSYSGTLDSYGAPTNNYNSQNNGYGTSNGYYASTDYAAPGTSQVNYGSLDTYGAPSVSAYKPEYSAPSPSYNPPKPTYNNNKPSYNSNSNSANSGYAAPSYQSDFTPVDPPKTNSHNNNNHHSHDQVTAVNIHHHYHHGAAQDVDQNYYRKEGDVNGVYLNDDDIFKRETVPNSGGALPSNMPAKGTGGGLRFPGSRNINLGTGGQKLPLHLRDREPHSLEADASFANQLPTKQVEAPTCGGPGSGFVCCRF